MNKKIPYIIIAVALILGACDKDDDNEITFTAKDPDTAEIAEVDRFGAFGTLMKRSVDATLPDPNEAINFDKAPFITQAFGPEGQVVKYYNFDVQPEAAAPLYLIFRESETNPVDGQLPIFDVIPGDLYYNDFWRVYKVTVPDNYVANAITSYDEIYNGAYQVDVDDLIINCPVVPPGSTASLKYNSSEANVLGRAWYKGKIVYYFSFEERDLYVNSDGLIPTSPIYVTFNINPDANNPTSGPVSGLPLEPGSNQTHSVIASIPTDSDYSPFWAVYVYDNADFANVNDLNSAQNATILLEKVMLVNCPVVWVEN